jgi:hypothetical protein
MFLRKWPASFHRFFPGRRGRSEPRLDLHRFRPMVDLLEDRLAPSFIIVNTLADPQRAGDGLVSLRDAILASVKRISVDGSAVGTG